MGPHTHPAAAALCRNLLRRLLAKEPQQRLTLEAVVLAAPAPPLPPVGSPVSAPPAPIHCAGNGAPVGDVRRCGAPSAHCIPGRERGRGGDAACFHWARQGVHPHGTRARGGKGKGEKTRPLPRTGPVQVMLKAKMRRLLARTRETMRKPAAAAGSDVLGRAQRDRGTAPGPVPVAATQAGVAEAVLGPDSQRAKPAQWRSTPAAATTQQQVAAADASGLSGSEVAGPSPGDAAVPALHADGGPGGEEGWVDVTPRDSMASTVLSGAEGVHEFDAAQDLDWQPAEVRPGMVGSVDAPPAQRAPMGEGGEDARAPRASNSRLSWSCRSHGSEASAVTSPAGHLRASSPGLRRNRSEGGRGNAMRWSQPTKAGNHYHHESVGALALADDESPGHGVPGSSDSSESLVRREPMDDEGEAPSTGHKEGRGARQLKRKHDFVMVRARGLRLWGRGRMEARPHTRGRSPVPR